MAEEKAAAKCPICGRPTERRWRPFCSKRCADIDLGRWLKGQYALPAEEAPDPDLGRDLGPDAEPGEGR